MRRRRAELNLSQRDAAGRARMSDQTWLNVENGRGASDRKLAQVERALDWPAGTVDAILAGEDPPSESSSELRSKVERLEREVAELRARLQERSDLS